MKFSWLEPHGAKRAREGGFADIFLTRNFYYTTGVFLVMFLVVLLIDTEPTGNSRPLPELIFYLVLIAVGVSFIVRTVYWVFPATIHMDDRGIHYQMGEIFQTDLWADISEARIEQRAGWKVLAYTVKGTGQKEWGISEKISAQGLLNFMQRKA